MLLTGRFPTDGANCRDGLSAMPSVGGLGLEESCELALDIGKPDKRGRFYPGSGPSEGKTRTSCLSDLLLQSNIGYNGVDLAED